MEPLIIKTVSAYFCDVVINSFQTARGKIYKLLIDPSLQELGVIRILKTNEA